MGFLRHIRALNPPIDEPLLPWLIDAQVVGWLRPTFVERLRPWSAVFDIQPDRVVMAAGLTGFEQRSAALAGVTKSLVAEGVISIDLNEPYPVTAGDRDAALCTLDRGSVAYFGVRSFGQHLNGYVRDGDEILMWLGRRAADRIIYPGRLDNLVAGGLPHGLSPWQNLVKEAREEAGMAESLVRRARPVGAVTYQAMSGKGLKPDVLFCYDLELPADFRPRNEDGEVEEFLLLPIQDVMECVRETDEFKLNCNLVVMDFLLRHGYIGPESAGFLDISTGLRPDLDRLASGW